jgi:hypothetical protein
MVQYRDTTVSGETIEFNNKDMHFLGPNLVLVDCHLIVNSARKGFNVSGFRMSGGTFEIASKLTDTQFDRVQFESVSFAGHFSGIDFGWWDDSEPGSIRDCDFSNATMQACRFLGAELSGITLPRWPHFAIPDPRRLASWVKTQTWPLKLDIMLEVATDVDPGCAAAVDNAQRLADADSISLDDMRALLEKIPGVMIRD